jgi:hypothetical protein
MWKGETMQELRANQKQWLAVLLIKVTIISLYIPANDYFVNCYWSLKKVTIVSLLVNVP